MLYTQDLRPALPPSPRAVRGAWARREEETRDGCLGAFGPSLKITRRSLRRPAKFLSTNNLARLAPWRAGRRGRLEPGAWARLAPELLSSPSPRVAGIVRPAACFRPVSSLRVGFPACPSRVAHGIGPRVSWRQHAVLPKGRKHHISTASITMEARIVTIYSLPAPK